MSDLCMYELEDIVWDEFDQSDDHIVPHPSDEQTYENTFQGDIRKKPCREVVGVSIISGEQNAFKCASHGKEQSDFLTPNNIGNTMLEHNSWSHTSEGVFLASSDDDSIKEATSIASKNTRMQTNYFKSSEVDSIGGEPCADDPILGDKCATVGNNSYNYSPSHVSQTDNDLSFFVNNHEDKESSDLLYYGWPDIGNLEDVDRMFRSCDSSFGLGEVGNEDELGWFSSSDDIDRSEGVLKFTYPGSSALENVSESHGPSKLNNSNCLINVPSMKSASVNKKDSSQPSEDDESVTLVHLSFVNGSNIVSESKAEFIPKEQGVQFDGGVQFKISDINNPKKDNSVTINQHKRKSKHRSQSGGERQHQYLVNGGSFYDIGKSRNKDPKLPSGDTTRQVSTSLNMQQKKNLGPNSFGYFQNNMPLMHSDYGYPSRKITTTPTPSGLKPENNDFMSLSSKESSYGSNQVQSLERSCDPSFDASAVMRKEKNENIRQRQGLHPTVTSNPKHVDMLVQTSKCDTVSVQNQIHHCVNEFVNHSDVEGVRIQIPAELGSSDVQESSSRSSGLEEISLVATGFWQLQLVMEQLDLWTKLCIRDSLYRLARGAEQRHNLNGGCGDDIDTSRALTADGANKCTVFLDIETDTNPIDRSIAHLLFHSPPDSSVKPAHDALSINSHSKIHGLVTSPPAMTEKQVLREETACETEREFAAADYRK